MSLTAISPRKLKREIVTILKKQGYIVKGNTFRLRDDSRETMRRVHTFSRAERVIAQESMILKKRTLLGSSWLMVEI